MQSHRGRCLCGQSCLRVGLPGAAESGVSLKPSPWPVDSLGEAGLRHLFWFAMRKDGVDRRGGRLAIHVRDICNPVGEPRIGWSPTAQAVGSEALAKPGTASERTQQQETVHWGHERKAGLIPGSEGHSAPGIVPGRLSHEEASPPLTGQDGLGPRCPFRHRGSGRGRLPG